LDIDRRDPGLDEIVGNDPPLDHVAHGITFGEGPVWDRRRKRLLFTDIIGDTIWEWEPGRMFYGFPDLGDGVKLAIHHEGEATTPAEVRRTVYPGEADGLLAVMATRTPLLVGPLRQSAVCLYSNTPDGDFILDRHPLDARVLLASPCSGHGFKFSPAIGEALADLVEDRAPRFDLTPFRLGRF